MTKTQAITIPDLDANLHAKAKAAAAIKRITLKDWIKEAIQEKLDRREKS
ncbi:3-hydroxyacyl-CoA dehydrogenase [bacterium]|nr:3-hydroxyacyl-CoA dehydrogenase [bacterium]